MKKVVNGIVFDMSPEEEVATRAFWDTDASKPTPLEPLPRWKFHAMLELAGKKPQVEAALDAMPLPEGVIARAKYYQADIFPRDDDMVLNLAPAIGLTVEQVDVYWRQAMALN